MFNTLINNLLLIIHKIRMTFFDITNGNNNRIGKGGYG